MSYNNNVAEITRYIHENMSKGFIKSIFIHQHLGLGDHFVCNGLTREIFKREDDASFFFMPVKFHNMGTLMKMYSDEKRMVLIPVHGDWNEIHNLPQLGFCCKKYQIGLNMLRSDWDVSFYDIAEVSFEKRWSSFKINRDLETENELFNKLNPNDEPFILVHDTASWGICPLDTRKDLLIIRVQTITESLTDWAIFIEKATEIHCIDSSFIHFVTSFGKKGTFHDFKKDSSWGANFKLPENWDILGYTDNSGVSVPFKVNS